MKVYILTIFPELFETYINHGLVKKAQERGLVRFEIINYRDFTTDPHRTVDDIPYGGGAGMVIKPEPVIKAFMSIPEEDRRRAKKIVLSARGKLFTQSDARSLAAEEVLIFFAARYKGFDQRIVDIMEAQEYSIGDYILQGGELPAMVMLDAVLRLIPGFIGDRDSADTDSFAEEVQILSAPDYTRPREFMGHKVPEVLLSGNHAQIARWRRKQGLLLTFLRRPDLLEHAALSDEGKKLLEEIKTELNLDKKEHS
ncbi:tRNA (guanosine(37)-N1)-methyltransferase TrmD [bacterium]|nr:tRNA (guanosine(37)-N1)-methyltransferase TrmD [bacterium]